MQKDVATYHHGGGMSLHLQSQDRKAVAERPYHRNPAKSTPLLVARVFFSNVFFSILRKSYKQEPICGILCAVLRGHLCSTGRSFFVWK